LPSLARNWVRGLGPAAWRHQEFEHHEIRQQDVRLGLPDPLAFVLVFLAGVFARAFPNVPAAALGARVMRWNALIAVPVAQIASGHSWAAGAAFRHANFAVGWPAAHS
jgi:hypothetical protein